MDLSTQLQSLLVVASIAAVAPALVAALPGPPVPQVVIFLLGGLIVGPNVAGIARPEQVELVANIGLGFVFLLAGYEVDLRLFRQSSGRLALISWTITAVIAVALVGLLSATGVVRAFVPVALALTTTALGTLLPILQANRMLSGAFGRYMLAAGAVGELLPVLAIAVFLGAKNKFVALVSIVLIAVLGLLLSSLAQWFSSTVTSPTGSPPDPRPPPRRRCAGPSC